METELTHKAKISTNAMAKLGKNEDVRLNILEKICTTLDCKYEVFFREEEPGEEKLNLLMVDNHIPAGAKLY